MENNKSVTAVEWLVEELTKQNMFMHLFAKEIEQAKAMEKEDKHSEYMRGWKDGLTKHETIKSE